MFKFKININDLFPNGRLVSGMCNFILILILISFVWGCGGDGGGGGDFTGNEPSGPGDSVSDGERGGYIGSASITIDYYDYDFIGNLIFIEQKKYNHDVDIITGPPKEAGLISEENPFNLHVSTQSIGSEGTFGISSAILNVALSGGPVLLEYWDLSLSGKNVQGTLTDTHTAESTAANHFYAWENMAGYKTTYVFIMETGTSLTGTITSEDAAITIEGQSTDGTRNFKIEISADRSD